MCMWDVHASSAPAPLGFTETPSAHAQRSFVIVPAAVVSSALMLPSTFCSISHARSFATYEKN